MAQRKKDYIPISFKMERQRADEMAEMAKETNLSKTAIMERAIEMYYRFYKSTGKV